MIRVLLVLVAGYVLGAKAGRRRYEQIVNGYQAVTGSPATRKLLEVSRRRLASSLSPDPHMVELTAIDETTVVLEPEPGER